MLNNFYSERNIVSAFGEGCNVESNIRIREARREDASAIATILRTLGWVERIKNETAVTTEQHVAHMLELAAQEDCNTVLVAEQNNGTVVGYLAAHWFPNLMRGLDGYVSELFVHPDATGQGAGSSLIEAVRGYAVKRGCTRIFLMNRRIRESYQRGFYAKHGWEELRDGAFFSLNVG
jgi:N-acetylglutamate synthase-like GNAT family acetyltransferase